MAVEKAQRSAPRDGASAAAPASDAAGVLRLDGFFPYRLSVLQLAVSRALAAIYAERFELTRHEWRAMAALGERAPLTANGIAGRTSMDKVQVSRAVAGLIAAGHVARRADPHDRRRVRLRLTRRGRGVYRRIVPLVAARERALLAALTADERRALGRSMEKLLARAQALGGPG